MFNPKLLPKNSYDEQNNFYLISQLMQYFGLGKPCAKLRVRIHVRGPKFWAPNARLSILLDILSPRQPVGDAY
jgi:hypothetical protein